MFGGTLGNIKTEKVCLKKTQENLKCHHVKVLDIYISDTLHYLMFTFSAAAQKRTTTTVVN